MYLLLFIDRNLLFIHIILFIDRVIRGLHQGTGGGPITESRGHRRPFDEGLSRPSPRRSSHRNSVQVSLVQPDTRLSP